jgi:hypothetical protein
MDKIINIKIIKEWKRGKIGNNLEVFYRFYGFKYKNHRSDLTTASPEMVLNML